MQCRYKTQMPGARDAGGRGERQANVARQTFSRCQVICAECEAWNQGEGPGTSTYFYDGISFWRREASGRAYVVPSWRAPGHGWRHAAGCGCELCTSRRPVPLQGLSVA